MKKILYTLILLCIPVITFANPGYYLQGQFGPAVVGNGVGFAPLNSNGYASRISGGYLWGDNNFNYGLESGVFYGPHLTSHDSFFEDSKSKIRVVNVDLLGIIKHTFDNGIMLLAKGGAAYTNQSVDTTINYSNGSQVAYDKTGKKLAPEAALGFGYQFNPNIEMNLTTNIVFAGNASDNNPAAYNAALMLGLTYHFV